MILTDTSVWGLHFRRGVGELARLLLAGKVLCHPFVIGEVALGTMRLRAPTLDQLTRLPSCLVASDSEVLDFIENHGLFGRGIGLVDVHLLASVRITPGSLLWTFDKRLHRVADEFDVAFRPGS